MQERVLAMKEIWTREEAEFHGKFVDFDKIWCYPKPAQRPHPPILMGGDGATTFDRVIEFCDGWMPIGGRQQAGAPSLPEKISTLRERARQAGRDPDSISITIFGSRPDHDDLDRLEQAGVERVVFGLPSAAREVVEPAVDKLAEFIR